jgi:uncharacterized protein YdbL (DUF1318 family)
MKYTTTILVYLFAGFFFATLLPAQDRSVMERMRERLPQIDSLLTSQTVGEGNRGLLVARVDLSDAQKALVEAENSDRVAVYGVIARRTESTPEAVGRQRALQIRERAAEGVWLQDEEGNWYRQTKRR